MEDLVPAIPVFSDFVQQAESFFSAAEEGSVTVRNRDLLLEAADGSTVTVSLNRLYRDYIETSLRNPTATHEEIMQQLRRRINIYPAVPQHINPLRLQPPSLWYTPG